MIELVKKIFSHRQIRFLFVGGINTLVGYGSYVLFVYVGIDYLIATTLSTVIGVINSYIWNRNFTFKSKKKVKKEIIKFISVYGVSYLLSMILIFILVKKIHFNEYLAGGINLVFTTLISWFGHKNFSFKEVKK